MDMIQIRGMQQKTQIELFLMTLMMVPIKHFLITMLLLNTREKTLKHKYCTWRLNMMHIYKTLLLLEAGVNKVSVCNDNEPMSTRSREYDAQIIYKAFKYLECSRMIYGN